MSRAKFNGSTLTMDEWLVKADHCRAWLHIHDLLPDAENEKVKHRTLKLIKAQHKKEASNV